MQLKTTSILLLLMILIAAPVVDATVCDDCKDVLSVREMQKVSAGGTCGLTSGTADPAQKGAGEVQDLCPVCANAAVAMSLSYCGAPALVSEANESPRLISLADPSYPITKPPQN